MTMVEMMVRCMECGVMSPDAHGWAAVPDAGWVCPRHGRPHGPFGLAAMPDDGDGTVHHARCDACAASPDGALWLHSREAVREEARMAGWQAEVAADGVEWMLCRSHARPLCGVCRLLGVDATGWERSARHGWLCASCLRDAEAA